MAENNVNYANRGSIGKGNEDLKSSETPQRTEEERRETRRGFKTLMETTAQFDEIEPHELLSIETNRKKFGKAIKKSIQLFREVDRPQEAVMDAQVFKQLSRLTKTQVEALSTNAQKFTSTDFAEKLVASWRGPTSLADFRRIGRRAQHAYGRPVAFNYLYGSLDVEPKPMKETKVRQSRRATGVDLSQLATQTSKTPQNPETAASLTEMLVNSTLMQLEDAYEVNDRNPISYFNFVLDPQSFTKSVENMFHFSFLVKEGKASFRLDDDGRGLPFVAPIKASKKSGSSKNPKEENDAEDRHQAIISLAYDDWEDLIEQLDIDRAIVNHDIDALREKRNSKKAKHAKRSDY